MTVSLSAKSWIHLILSSKIWSLPPLMPFSFTPNDNKEKKSKTHHFNPPVAARNCDLYPLVEATPPYTPQMPTHGGTERLWPHQAEEGDELRKSEEGPPKAGSRCVSSIPDACPSFGCPYGTARGLIGASQTIRSSTKG